MKSSDTAHPRIPAATCRLQFNGNFRFSDAERIVPYLHQLGISDIYSSPYLKARQGSLHGYDIVDHNQLNPEVGCCEEYDRLCAELDRYGMGQILDIVPNHMCIEGGENRRWLDLLENGPSSSHADFFDIDWDPVKNELTDKVLLPILGDQYGAVLENGELKLSFADGAFHIRYYEHLLPIIPKTYRSILTLELDFLEQQLPPDDLALQELMSIVTALVHLPFYTDRDPDRIRERYREKEVIKRRLWALYSSNETVRAHIDRSVLTFNGTKGVPQSFDLLDNLLRQQVYRLAHWRTATEEINYRRFFDINALGAIRMEHPGVFEQTHRLVLDLVREGKVTGLRVDHADGLYDPADYFETLQRACFVQLQLARLKGMLPDNSEGLVEESIEDQINALYENMRTLSPKAKPFYIIGEKILSKSERLPEDWKIFSSTGYEFISSVTGLFVDSRNSKEFDSIYRRFIGEHPSYAEIVYEKKKLFMQVSMAAEINTLAYHLNEISEENRHTRDFTLGSLIKAVVEVIAYFPVYRTYIRNNEVTDRDRQYIASSVSRARKRNPAINASIFSFIEDVLLLRYYESTDEQARQAWLNFVMKFQQLTGPVMAKGAEDTAFYVYNRLVALNEVGGFPDRFGISVEAFHGQNIDRLKNAPKALLATATHDTKRGEDVRARISVLSEIPGAWREWLARWSRMNRHLKKRVDGEAAPDRNEEYLLYQTIIGAYPPEGLAAEGRTDFAARIKAYMIKAMREAKNNTSWISPNSFWEEAVLHFVDSILTSSTPFLADLEKQLPLLIQCGLINSLSQVLLKISSPGIPDFYQGTELWDFSLVDPDNRRPVDYRIRIDLLDELTQKELSEGMLETCRQMVTTRIDGRIKLYLTRKALNFRRENLELFESGRYLPLMVEGSCQDHVCAFERSVNDSSILVVVPLSCSRLLHDSRGLPLGQEVWQDTRLIKDIDDAAWCYRNIFTGEVLNLEEKDGRTSLALQDVLSAFPVALLERQTAGLILVEPSTSA